MITVRKFAMSAVATLGLFVFGAVNSANAGHPGSGREMGHGPVVKSSGKIGKESGKSDKNKFDKERKEWEFKYWNRYTCRYEYSYPTCSYPVETYAPVCPEPVVVPVESQPVCEVPVCTEPVAEPIVVPIVVPTTCYEYPRSYEFCKPYEFHKPCKDGSKPTTASSLRNTENLGGSHTVASHMSGGRGRK